MGPALLITLGVLLLLNSFGVLEFGQTWPVLFLVIGAILIVSRTGPTEGHMERGWMPSPMAPPPPTPPAEQQEPQVKS